MGQHDQTQLRLGAWARTSNLIGLVAKVEDGQVTLLHPGHRQLATVPAAEVEPVPASAVTVTASADLPLAHGLEEGEVRRWLASLLDETLRERALSALGQEGVDEGAALPSVRLTVAPLASGAAVCLCGGRTPAPRGAAMACPACGREAVAPPAAGGTAAPS